MLYGTMITWLRCTKWAWQSAWQCILTLLLITYPSSQIDPQSKWQRRKIWCIWHLSPMSILTIEGTSPKQPDMSMMIKFIWFSLWGNETSKWSVFQNDATMQLINGLIFHVQLQSCDEHELGFRLKSDGISLFTFHKPLKIISW